MPHRQTFGRLRVNGRLALHSGPCRLRELGDEAVCALIALTKGADNKWLHSPKSVEPMENRPLRVQWEEQVIYPSSVPEPLR